MCPKDGRSVLQRIKDGYDHDAWFIGTQLNGNLNTHALIHHDGAWYTAKTVSAGEQVRHRIVVPNAPNLRQFILTELHDSPTGGHFGVTKTQQALQPLLLVAHLPC